MKFLPLVLLPIIASAKPAWKNALQCEDGYLVISCFQSLTETLKVGESSTEYVTCGRNGCECTSTCGNGCQGYITATLEDFVDGESATITLDGLVVDKVSFKASTDTDVKERNEAGDFVYQGLHAISHVDFCVSNTQPVLEELVNEAPEPVEQPPEPVDEPLEPATCSCGAHVNPCKDYVCENGECVEVHLADGTPCGVLGDGQCQLSDTCSNGQCLTNQFKPEGTPCGDTTTVNACNAADSCSADGKCLPNLKPEGTVCGKEETECMWGDKCSFNGECIIGQPKEMGTGCGDSSDSVCDHPDTCDGTGQCVKNLMPDGFECGAPESECSFADTCSNGLCTQNFKSMDTMCGPTELQGPCDAQNYCNGEGGCTEMFASTETLCRAAVSECDVDEFCTGDAMDCPDDLFATMGTSCGSSEDTECTNPDTCDGGGNCLSNHEADGSSCGFLGDECNLPDSCMAGVCVENGPKPNTTPCGTIEGPCDVQDFCNNGVCVDKVADTSVVCREARNECDVEERCDSVSKNCPADEFQPMDTPCGKKGDELEYCENQDICFNGECIDMGIDPVEYTFKCATVNYLCGNEVTGTGCQDGTDNTVKASDEDCKLLIAALNDPTVNIYGVKCPNGRSVSHYVRYDCRGVYGEKCELDKDACKDSSLSGEECDAADLNELCFSCARRRFLRNIFH